MYYLCIIMREDGIRNQQLIASATNIEGIISAGYS